MKVSSVSAALLPLVSAQLYTKEEYRSGAVMSQMMAAKEVQHPPPSRILINLMLMEPGFLGLPPRTRRIR